MASVRDIRVCLVGDEGVGKSTLISSLIKEQFVKLAPRTVLPEVTIPPSVTPGHHVTTIIIDTSPRSQDRAHLVNEIRKAHVVAIVYAIDNPTSFDRVPTYWLPTIRSLGVNVPVILIGNKIDLRSGQVTNEALEDECVPIMHEFKEVETVVECSARIPLNVGECFYFAQNAVLHPTAPLYDTREHTLKPACVAALSRIFKLCDINKDGLLSDDELNDFQRVCFDAPLQARELAGIKEVVSRGTQDDEQPGIVEDALTEEGFLYLHTYFIQKGRLETTWKALRTFGYGEDLSLREDFLHPRFDIPADCTAELSPKGYQWFTDIFETFDKDQDGALAPCEVDDLFSTSPGNPWLANGFPGTTITNDGGHVTLQGWLAQWSMTTLLEPRVTLAYLAYLGYSHSGGNVGNTSGVAIGAGTGSGLKLSDSTSALTITRPRKQDRKKGTVQRNVFLAYVLGAAGSGKTNLLRAFVGKGMRDKHEPTMRNETVVGSVEWGGGEKYLVVSQLQEFGSNYESEMLRMSKKLAMADALIFVYDSSDTNSFSYISNLRQHFKLDDHPSLFVATKSDLDLAQQRHEVQPDTYCRKLGLQVPVAVSVKQGQLADLFHTMTSIATHPLSSIPNSNRKNSNSSTSLFGIGIPAHAGFTTYLYATAGVVGLVAVGAMVWKSVVKGKTMGNVVGGLGVGVGGSAGT
ncbi:BQ2448_8134 [Microbotryum intermedium]|uniref:Mitochondrial Rho GTPase n=1 Tax=Microbotryum intermedium TaxID=269621 RepID=A0A238FR94_9BASI|nr:BQ2448_8134 [Microbotryum intermedium]